MSNLDSTLAITDRVRIHFIVKANMAVVSGVAKEERRGRFSVNSAGNGI